MATKTLSPAVEKTYSVTELELRNLLRLKIED